MKNRVLRGVFSSAGIAVLMSGCSAPVEQAEEPKIVEPIIPKIPGNAAHNLVASYSAFERNGALAAVVKQQMNKPRCSLERIEYQGERKASAFWSVACHDGTEFQIVFRPNGSGAVAPCVASKQCWSAF
jgi:hypothetical protein